MIRKGPMVFSTKAWQSLVELQRSKCAIFGRNTRIKREIRIDKMSSFYVDREASVKEKNSVVHLLG